MSHPSGDAQNGKQVSPPPYTPLTGPAGDALNAARGEAKKAFEELWYSFRGAVPEPQRYGLPNVEWLDGKPLDTALTAMWEHYRQHAQPVAVDQSVDEAVVLGRIRAVVDAWVSPLLPRGEAAGQMLEAVRPYLRVGARGAALEQGVEHQHCIGCGARFEVTSDTAFRCEHCLRPAIKATGSQLVIGDSHNGPVSDTPNVGSFTRATGRDEDCRAAFEHWFADGFPGQTEIVEDDVTRGMWQAWQAVWGIRTTQSTGTPAPQTAGRDEVNAEMVGRMIDAYFDAMNHCATTYVAEREGVTAQDYCIKAALAAIQQGGSHE